MPRMTFPWRSVLVTALVVGVGTLILDAPTSPPGQSVARKPLPWEAAPAKPAPAPPAAASVDRQPNWTASVQKVDPASSTQVRVEPEKVVVPYPEVLAVPRTVRTIDSVTILIGDQEVRLSGLVPVPPSASCQRRGGGQWACGLRGRSAFRSLVGGKALQCRNITLATDPRVVDCQLSGERLAKTLVAAGWALPEEKGDADLDAALAAARQAKAGVWASPDLDAADATPETFASLGRKR
jgi:endonuclease YncB( thermonuclease family)